ncbi:MAG: hypothetical protein JW843_11165 [Candidatus Aminicenantes bacterium]|nr:hypothetical protein [Candidatus Aminicenantes bacterium]
MKKRLVAAMLVFGLAAGAASADILTFKMGYFAPRLTGDFWDIEFENMTYKKSSFQDASIGIHYELFLSRTFSLTIGADIFRKNKAALYQDVVGYSLADGDYAFPADEFRGQFELKHSITLASAPIQLSFKWVPLGRRGNLIPYLGGGVHAMIWNIRMQGDMVDFGDEYIYEDPWGTVFVYPIYSVYAEESEGLGRVSFGWQAFGGLMIPFGTRMTADVGVKYLSCPVEFANAFQGFEAGDAGGLIVFAGINYWF